MVVQAPYLLFIGDVQDTLAAKTAQGVLEWRPERCLGQYRMPGCRIDLGINDMTIEEAVKAGAKTFVVGAVNAGGILKNSWTDVIVEAIEAGLDVASGLHARLHDQRAIARAAERHDITIHELRHSDRVFKTGQGTRRSGKRLLTVGTDCSVGKKYAALALERDMRAAGYTVEFCATGQTGILIADRGVALDAVVSDFISGAAEWLTPAIEPDHWQIVEGQGSLFHPSFAGVTLGLLHGAQPDAFVVCHEPSRTTMRGVQTPLPTIGQVIEQTTALGRLTNPDIRCVGICINTQALDEGPARELLGATAAEYDLPCIDPIRFGTAAVIEQIARQSGEEGR
jgi:uncharacterized NAD-dependent epimerase/dehydratase family protein